MEPQETDAKGREREHQEAKQTAEGRLAVQVKTGHRAHELCGEKIVHVLTPHFWLLLLSRFSIPLHTNLKSCYMYL